MGTSVLQSLEEAIHGLDRGQPACVVGATAGWRAMLVAQAMTRLEGPPLLYVTPDEHAARQFMRDVAFFSGAAAEAQPVEEVLWLREIDTSPYADVAADPRTVSARMSSLARLASASRPPRLVVASLRSLTRMVIPPEAFDARVCRWTLGETVERDDAIAVLVDAGFERVEIVEDPGTFAVRGYVVDVFVPRENFPLRLEWFGDELEQIRSFDPATQRSLRSHSEVEIHPAREAMITSPDTLREKILRLADELELPSSTTRGVLESLRDDLDFFGREALTPLMHRAMVPVWAYLPADTRWLVEEAPQLCALYARMREAYDHQRAALTQTQQLSAPAEAFFVSEEALSTRLHASALSFASVVGALDDPATPSARLIRVHAASNTELRTSLEGARGSGAGDVMTPLAAHLKGLGASDDGVIEAPWDVVIVTLNETHRARIVAALERKEVIVTPPSPGERGLTFEPPVGPALHSRVRVIVGDLVQGFACEEDRVLLLSESEVFGRRTRKHRKGGRRRRLSGLAQLGVGDFVVHFTHGIGRYDGIQQMSVGGTPGDYVLIQYAGSDKLFLPVHRVGEIERFSATEDRAPKLDKLGGHTFEARTRKVKADVRQMADELLQIYAQREAQTGFAHPAVVDACAEFDQTFPFEETQDQLDAIDAVSGDLGAPRPMDRVICGDVGFGKTEVALRAAFRVAAGGKQVAVLAPTTVLVQQHYMTFSDRLSPFPLRVGCLNRFQPKADREAVLEGIQRGTYDVVIGTHRLLSADVRFRDLGLVVIDEEQRFGVRQKERFKRLKTEVDVLTLTATPIPRTLHLSLLGIREISMISTPPMDRLSVRTYLTRSSDVVLEQGIARELKRGGQVFVVVPRVLGIEEHARRLRALIPDARVGIAHGQMPAKLLEGTMLDFMEHRLDILVCTTIIESGLDIPRANTMFIERADLFGMAQLHQLRGRIGRGRLRAHCYLLVNSLEGLTAEARQRLDGVVRHGELGAGFGVATRDLEIRGAGDILGKRQSGAIQSVGFDAYARLLAEAVAELRGDPVLQREDTELTVDIAVFIPNDYVVDTGQRLDLYRRLARAASVEAVDEVMAEMVDRYGEMPREAAHYGTLMRCRVLARRLGVLALDLRGVRLTLRWAALEGEHAARLHAFTVARPGQFSWSSPRVLKVRLADDGPRGGRGVLAECATCLAGLPS